MIRSKAMAKQRKGSYPVQIHPLPTGANAPCVHEKLELNQQSETVTEP
jgi:hypothetical protein